jgi:hypothetical protein
MMLESYDVSWDYSRYSLFCRGLRYACGMRSVFDSCGLLLVVSEPATKQVLDLLLVLSLWRSFNI